MVCFVSQPELNKRGLALCLSSSLSEYHSLLHTHIPCKVIYSKGYGNGTLYALVLSKKAAHATLDRKIVELDRILMQASGDSSTRFTSVSDVMEGKVKTFGVGEHMGDEHFRAIFSSCTPGGGRELLVHPEVARWDPPLAVGTGNVSVVGDGNGVSNEELREQAFLDKTVQKLRSKICIYKRVLSAAGKNVADLKQSVDDHRVELMAKVCFMLAHDEYEFLKLLLFFLNKSVCLYRTLKSLDLFLI